MNLNESNDLQDEEILEAQISPPSHLTWIEGAAWVVVALVILVSALVLEETWYEEVDAQSLLSHGLYAVANATGVIGIFYLARTSVREPGEPFQPGQWLLILMGTSAPFYVLSNMTQIVLFYDGFADVESYRWASTAASVFWQAVEWCLVLTLAFLLPVRSMWRVLVVIYFLGAMAGLVELAALQLDLHPEAEAWYGYVSIRWFLLSAVALVCFAIWDVLTTHQRRDWLHWVGIGNELVFFTPTFVVWVHLLGEVESAAGVR